MKQLNSLKNIVKVIFNKKEYKQILENIFSLGVLTILRYVFPIILIPFLLKVLGTNSYGKYAFSLSIFQSLVLIVKFGFDLYGTKLIARHKNDNDYTSVLFFSITSIRLMISLFISTILIILVYTIDFFKGLELLYIYGIGILIGTAITPVWFFQGIEKMKYLTIINFIFKLIPTALIFIFIRSDADIELIHLFNSIGYIVAGILSYLLVRKTYPLILKPVSYNEIKHLLKEGSQIFITSISINLYRNLNQVVLGIIVSYEAVAFYDAAEKIVKAFQNLLNSVSRALFPFFSRELTISKNKSFLKFGHTFSAFLLFITIGLVLLSPYFLPLYYGQGYEQTILNFRIQAIIILFGGMNFYFGINGLLNLGYQNSINLFLIITGISSIIFCSILAYFFNDIGASIALVLSEFLLTFLIVFKLSKIFRK